MQNSFYLHIPRKLPHVNSILENYKFLLTKYYILTVDSNQNHYVLGSYTRNCFLIANITNIFNDWRGFPHMLET